MGGVEIHFFAKYRPYMCYKIIATSSHLTRYLRTVNTITSPCLICSQFVFFFCSTFNMLLTFYTFCRKKNIDFTRKKNNSQTDIIKSHFSSCVIDYQNDKYLTQ